MSKIKPVFSHFGKFCINAQNHNADIVDFAYIVSLNSNPQNVSADLNLVLGIRRFCQTDVIDIIDNFLCCRERFLNHR